MKALHVSLFRSVVCAFFVSCVSLAFAQEASTEKKIKGPRPNPELFFLQEGDVPNSYLLLPPPPDGASITFLNDQARYNWGKTMRNTPRGDQAVTDARVSGNGVPEAFSEAFGIEISEDLQPRTARRTLHQRLISFRSYIHRLGYCTCTR